MKKEQQAWDVNGALENVDTAQSALELRLQGKELDKYFDKRRKEVQEAQKPRAPAMQQPKTFDEEKGDVLPNGWKMDCTLPVGRKQEDQQGAGAEQEATPESAGTEKEAFDSSATATPEDERKGDCKALEDNLKDEGTTVQLHSTPAVS
jgi:hypothetical protein